MWWIWTDSSETTENDVWQSSVSCQPPMFGNCFFKMFCDSLIKLSSRRPLLRTVVRSFSRTLILTDLVSFVEVFCPLCRHQTSKASLPKCLCLGVTVPNDSRSLVLNCQMMFSAQYRLRFGDFRDPLVTLGWWYKDLTTPAPVCLLFLLVPYVL